MTCTDDVHGLARVRKRLRDQHLSIRSPIQCIVGAATSAGMWAQNQCINCTLLFLLVCNNYGLYAILTLKLFYNVYANHFLTMSKRSVCIVTSCTNRKRTTNSAVLRIGSISRDSVSNVAKQWMSQIKKERSEIKPALEVYVGRAFSEAQVCKQLTNGRLFIVSAGLGLISDQTHIPTYDLTIASSPANVASRIVGKEFSRRTWWARICRLGSNKDGISGLIRTNRATVFYIALPSPYLDMVAEDLEQIPDHLAKNVRIFSSEEGRRLLPKRLLPSWMPYDARLDGPDSPIPGTKSDFAQRAMRHFLENVVQKGGTDPRRDAKIVAECLLLMNYPNRPIRTRMTDSEITAVMKREFHNVGGRASEMLPHLRRTLGIACEQGRFSRLFRDLKADQERTT